MSATLIRQRVEWVHDPLVFWSGRLPRTIHYPGAAYRPTLHLIGKRLLGLTPGIYRIQFAPAASPRPSTTDFRRACRGFNPVVKSVKRVEEADIAQAARALRKALDSPATLAGLVGDVAEWCSRAESALRRVSAALKASSLEAPPDCDSLALEERCWWIGPAQDRPSKRLTTPQLSDGLRVRSNWTSPGIRLACLLHGQRRVPPPGLSRELEYCHRLGASLPGWPPDLLAQATGASLEKRPRLPAEGSGLARDWNRPEAAALVQEFLWAGGSRDLAEVFRGLSDFIPRVDRVLRLADARFQQLLALLEEVEQRCPLLLKKPQNHWLGPWHVFDQELLTALAALNAGRESFRAPRVGGWRVIDLAFRQLLGVSFPDGKTPVRPFPAAGPEAAKRILIEKLERAFAAAISAPHPGWMATLCGTAGRISGWMDACQLDRFAALLEAGAANGAPGRRSDATLRSTQHLLEFWMAFTQRTPANIARLMELLAGNLREILEGLRAESGGQVFAGSLKRALTGGWWVLGRMEALTAEQAAELVKCRLVYMAANILESRPHRLAEFVAHMSAEEASRFRRTHASPWVTLFGEENDQVLRWGLEIHQRLLQCTNGLESPASSMLRDLLENLKSERPLELLLVGRIRPLEELIASVARSRIRLNEAGGDPPWQSWTVTFTARLDILRLAAVWKRRGFPGEDQLIAFLHGRCDEKDQRPRAAGETGYRRDYWGILEPEARVAIANGNPDTLWTLLETKVRAEFRWDEALCGWNLLNGHPIARSFVEQCLRAPKMLGRGLELLGRLGLVTRLHTRDVFENSLENWIAPASPRLELDEALPADLAREVALLAAHRKQADEPTPFPKSIQDILDRPRALRRELDYLVARNTSNGGGGKIQTRIANLRRQLADATTLNQWITKDLRHALPEQLQLSRLAALEVFAENAVQAHWRRVIGIEAPVGSGPDWDNALRLLTVIRFNKGLLKRLLRHEARGERQWILEHAGNQQWIRTIARSGIRTDRWLATPEWTVPLRGAAWRVHVESDPLKVLQMGNLFGTCLSTGSFNDFSAVANAVEANKRVLYLTNSAGKIVGRKLITLVEHKGRAHLVGFHSYGAGDVDIDEVAGSRGDPWVKILFDVMCGRIARDIGASLDVRSSDGDRDEYTLAEKSRLFAQWYNDGAEPFDWWVASELMWPGDQHSPDRGLVMASVGERLATPDEPRASCLRALLWFGSEGQELVRRKNGASQASPLSVEECGYLKLHFSPAPGGSSHPPPRKKPSALRARS